VSGVLAIDTLVSLEWVSPIGSPLPEWRGLTAEMGLVSPVLQPTKTRWISFFYQLPVFLHFLSL
jgi:hypothetical protein